MLFIQKVMCLLNELQDVSLLHLICENVAQSLHKVAHKSGLHLNQEQYYSSIS